MLVIMEVQLEVETENIWSVPVVEKERKKERK